jgi:uncharacterized protein (DUF1330 family)
MPAYVIVDSDIHDLEQYKQAQGPGFKALEDAGGRFIARGGDPLVLEGDWAPKRLSLIEFPDVETARRWYESADYQEAKGIRAGAATLSIVAFPGAD